jgi:hypothetical protein
MFRKEHNASVKGLLCAICGQPAVNAHHTVRESRGGKGTPTVPLCRAHHIAIHSASGEFSLWGSLGGTKTQYGPNATYRRNLKQYR